MVIESIPRVPAEFRCALKTSSIFWVLVTFRVAARTGSAAFYLRTKRINAPLPMRTLVPLWPSVSNEKAHDSPTPRAHSPVELSKLRQGRSYHGLLLNSFDLLTCCDAVVERVNLRMDAPTESRPLQVRR